ncbi:NAD(P)H-dependent flavin oxidoreductase [Aquabacterium sp.]|uniref:NAD(P)H-dependent flavin oxidoreductase n=1 Tax=Aquabacterium sp. TaxID=1872578 RepID=UPI0037833183
MSAKLPFLSGLQLPLIAAPMLRISGIELVSAACRAGIVGAFPTPNARTLDELEGWLQRLDRERDVALAEGRPYGPYCPNLIMRRDPAQLRDAVERFAAHRTQVVITSVGSPAALMPQLKDAGIAVLADVASVRHAEKALQAGVDGLVLLTAGAGGKTGWANPFAFVRAVRAFYDGPIVLAGGLSDGASLWAARTLGCTLGYMGTRFIATRESLAAQAYRQMVVDASMDDIVLTRALTGLPASWLRGSLEAAGLDLKQLPEHLSPEQARERFGADASGPQPARWADIWSAGHSCSGVHDVPAVAELVARLRTEYDQARAITRNMSDLIS